LKKEPKNFCDSGHRRWQCQRPKPKVIELLLLHDRPCAYVQGLPGDLPAGGQA
jgi:hypothetical protein